MKLFQNERGSFVFEAILIVLVLMAAGSAYYFAHKVKTTQTDYSVIVPKSTKTTSDETAKWLLYTSTGKEYKLRLADGLNFVGNNTTPSIYTYDSIQLGSGTAKVTITGAGGDNPYGLFINYFAKSSDAKVRGDKQTGFKTNSGLDVEKYYYVETAAPQALGLGKGDKEYDYRITKDGKALEVTYTVGSSATPNTSLVEQMVKTVELP